MASVVFRLIAYPVKGSAIFLALFCVVGFGITPFLLKKTGHLQLLGAVPAVGLLLAVSGLSMLNAGMFNQSLPALLVAPLIAAVFSGHRFAGFLTIVCTLVLIFITTGHILGWYAANEVGEAPIIFRLFVYICALGFNFALIYLYEKSQGSTHQLLLQKESRYSLAISATDDGLFDWDIKAGHTYFSPTFLALLGYKEDELTLASPFDEVLFSPSHLARVQLALKKHQNERVPFELEAKIRNARGEESWFHIRGETLWEGKNAQRMIGFIRDIAEQKQMERIKEEFISNVGHEFRTPLTSIIGSVRLMSQGDMLGEEQKQDMLQIAHRNSEQLLTLVDDLLDLQKLQSGPLPLSRMWTDLPTLAEEAAAALTPLLDKKALKIKWSIAPTVPPLSLDPDRIRQALGHLLSQAIKHSPKSETIAVEIKRHKSKKKDDGKERIYLSVSDHGPGIAPEDQPYVFDRMAHWDVAKKSQGTGLGMALAKRIAEAHDGTLEFTTDPERGTTFTMWLPMGNAPSHHTPDAEPAASSPSLDAP